MSITPAKVDEDLVSKISFKTEQIFTWDKQWEAEMTELLLDAWESNDTNNILNELKKEEITFLLFKKMLFFAFEEIKKNNTAHSINVYLKDLSNKKLIEIIKKYEEEYKLNPELLIFEILEYDYWTFNQDAIENLIKLKNKWYKFAIDDFNLEADENDLSYNNLITMLEIWIKPDYVKIDWWYLQTILSNSNYKSEKELRLIIKFLKANEVKVIWEWILDVKQWNIAKSLWIELFQWKYLKEDFYIKEETLSDKIKKFMINNKMRSFKLYRDILIPDFMKKTSTKVEQILKYL